MASAAFTADGGEYDCILQKRAFVCLNIKYSIDKIALFAIQWDPNTKMPGAKSCTFGDEF